MYRKVKGDLANYEKQSEITFEFSRKNDTANAVRELEKLAAIATEVSTSLENGVKYNEKLAQDKSVISEKDYASAKWILAATTIAITGFLALIGWFIYQQISYYLSH